MTGRGPGDEAPAGWYEDPVDERQSRYWDGRRWTLGVARGGRISEQPLDPGAAREAWAEREDRRAGWPARSAVIAVLGALGADALAAGTRLVAQDVAGASRLVTFVAAQSALWLGLLVTCALVSHRYGSGSLAGDYALRLRLSDVGRGIALSAVGRLLVIAVVVPLVLLLDLPRGTSLQDTEDLASGAVGIAMVFAVLVVGAPFFEELFFRGLLQRALEARLAVPAAIALQAVLFALAHLGTRLGAANLVIFSGTLVVGLVLGASAWRYRRLGPGMAAHGLFNLLPAMAIALG